ncbi:MAG TPA: exodeoxyribonuclease III [Fastidiosipila sp.]|jgi:exodeoxyribonuclease-3|nr:exodeoxyribonuclease III [Fastidiosipila sp.]
MRLVSWNVNGLRAVARKDNLKDAFALDPDVLCLQEIKAMPEQLPADVRSIDGYHAAFNPAERKGYSGTAIYSKRQVPVSSGLGLPHFDIEGRVQVADFDDFLLYNIYYPNGKASDLRLQYKLDFYESFYEHVLMAVDSGRDVVICGDVNTAHKPIDLARPRENEKVSGFLPIERAFLDRFLEAGFVDTFRMFNDAGEHYTWWDMITRARERNVGWRIDYFFVNKRLAPKVIEAAIHPDIMGSDHCPVSLTLAI